MANVGSAASGKTLIGAGNGASPTYANIGTNSGLTQYGVLIAEGMGSFQTTTAGGSGQVLMGNTGANPSFQTGGSVFGQTITGDSGGALSPSSGNWNLLGSGSITSVGSSSTLTTQLTGLTNHNVLVGAGTTTITKVAPSATAGIPLVSNGSSSDPSFTTAVVAGGGTGRTTLTNHGVLVGAATTAITQLAAGSAGQVLQSGGSSADPAYSTPTYPSASGTSRKIIVSDGTNNVYSTETWAVPGTSGNVLTSNGTNWTSAASTAGIGTINGDSGSATGATVTLRAFAGGNAGATIKFAASGSTISLNVVDGNDNLMLGRVAGNSTESGSWNVGLGTGALNALTSANQNTCVGFTSGLLINSGSANTSYGYTSLAGLTTGTGNHVFGYLSGNTYTGAESSNILICNGGVNGESNVTRIGNNGTGSLQQNKCYISGITGATVTGTAVLCAADGQLGTIASSRRVKENISYISQEKSILGLCPVEFNYKTDKLKTKVYGLIAEEVHEIFPDLCFYRDGEPDSVKYHEMPALLLHEIHKLNKRIQYLEEKIK